MVITLNIPISPSLKKKVDNIIKENDYASVSEMFLDAVRLLEDKKLLEDIMESEKDFSSGKFKRLSSLKKLI